MMELKFGGYFKEKWNWFDLMQISITTYFCINRMLNSEKNFLPTRDSVSKDSIYTQMMVLNVVNIFLSMLKIM